MLYSMHVRPTAILKDGQSPKVMGNRSITMPGRVDGEIVSRIITRRRASRNTTGSRKAKARSRSLTVYAWDATLLLHVISTRTVNREHQGKRWRQRAISESPVKAQVEDSMLAATRRRHPMYPSRPTLHDWSNRQSVAAALKYGKTRSAEQGGERDPLRLELHGIAEVALAAEL